MPFRGSSSTSSLSSNQSSASSKSSPNNNISNINNNNNKYPKNQIANRQLLQDSISSSPSTNLAPSLEGGGGGAKKYRKVTSKRRSVGGQEEDDEDEDEEIRGVIEPTATRRNSGGGGRNNNNNQQNYFDEDYHRRRRQQFEQKEKQEAEERQEERERGREEEEEEEGERTFRNNNNNRTMMRSGVAVAGVGGGEIRATRLSAAAAAAATSKQLSSSSSSTSSLSSLPRTLSNPAFQVSQRVVSRRLAGTLGDNSSLSSVPRPKNANPLLKRDWDVAAESSEPPIWLKPTSSPFRKPSIYFSRGPVRAETAPPGSVCLQVSQLGRAVPLFKVTSQSCEYFALRLPLLKGGFKRIADAEFPIDANVMWGKSWPVAQAIKSPSFVQAQKREQYQEQISQEGGEQKLSSENAVTKTSSSTGDRVKSLIELALSQVQNGEPCFRRPLHRFQKVNHFSGSHKNLGCKSGMARNLQKLSEFTLTPQVKPVTASLNNNNTTASKSNNNNNNNTQSSSSQQGGEEEEEEEQILPGEDVVDFVPRTFRMPEEAAELREALAASDANEPWIIKPSRGSCGRGVRVFKPDDVEVASLVSQVLHSPNYSHSGRTAMRSTRPVGGYFAPSQQQQAQFQQHQNQQNQQNQELNRLQKQQQAFASVIGTGVTPSGRFPLHVVQEYIRNPLLIAGRKFDFRVYVVATSFDPLVAYIHHSGLVRFAAKQYDVTESDITDVYSHLTNYSVGRKLEAEEKEKAKGQQQKKNQERQQQQHQNQQKPLRENESPIFGSSTSTTTTSSSSSTQNNNNNNNNNSSSTSKANTSSNNNGTDFSLELKWSMEKFNDYLSKTFGGEQACNKVWSDVEDVIIKTLFAVQPLIYQSAVKVEGSHDASIELYGFDVMLDANLKPWLIEVNTLPSLESSSAFDYNVKSNVVTDILNLSQLQLYDRAPKIFEEHYPDIEAPRGSARKYIHDFASLYSDSLPTAESISSSSSSSSSATSAASASASAAALGGDGTGLLKTLQTRFPSFWGKQLSKEDDAKDTVARVRDEMASMGGFRLMFPTAEKIERIGVRCATPSLRHSPRNSALWYDVLQNPHVYEKATRLKFPPLEESDRLIAEDAAAEMQQQQQPEGGGGGGGEKSGATMTASAASK